MSKLPDWVRERVTKAQILQGRDAEYPLTPQLEQNLDELWYLVNNLLQECCDRDPVLFPPDEAVGVSSGYRPGRFNKAAGGAKASAHLTCQAVDLVDLGAKRAKFLARTVELLQKHQLNLEHPVHTPSWCHLDTKDRGRPNGYFFRL